MKKPYLIIPLIIVLLALAVILVGSLVRHQQTEEETTGSITLKCGGREIPVSVSDLDREDFSGETTNGNGEHFNDDYRGVELRTILSEADISPDSVNEVTAIASDQYTATYSGDEIREPGRVYLAVEVNGNAVMNIDGDAPGVQIIVFDDPDGHRLVRSLEVLDIK